MWWIWPTQRQGNSDATVCLTGGTERERERASGACKKDVNNGRNLNAKNDCHPFCSIRISLAQRFRRRHHHWQSCCRCGCFSWSYDPDAHREKWKRKKESARQIVPILSLTIPMCKYMLPVCWSFKDIKIHCFCSKDATNKYVQSTLYGPYPSLMPLIVYVVVARLCASFAVFNKTCNRGHTVHMFTGCANGKMKKNYVVEFRTGLSSKPPYHYHLHHRRRHVTWNARRILLI